MNTLIETTQTSTIGQYDQMGIKNEDMGHIMKMLSRQYARPKDAVIRELWANGHDARMEAGSDRPVEITLPTRNHPELIVRDYGTGMSYNKLVENYCSYGSSDKRLTRKHNDEDAQQRSENSIGRLGIGSKSPIAVADQFSLTSIHQGHKYLVHIAIHDDGPQQKVIDAGETTEPDGVRVQVPAVVTEVSQWVSAARRVLFGINKEDVKLTQELEKLTNYVDYLNQGTNPDDAVLMLNNAWINSHRGNEPLVRMGQIIYEMSPEMSKNLCLEANHIIQAGTKALDTTPSRESLEDTKENRAALELIVTQWRNERWKALEKALDTADNNMTQWAAVKEFTRSDSYLMYRVTKSPKLMEKEDDSAKTKITSVTLDSAKRATMNESRYLMPGKTLAAHNANPEWAFIVEPVDDKAMGKVRTWLRCIGSKELGVKNLLLWGNSDIEDHVARVENLRHVVPMDKILKDVKAYEAEKRKENARRKEQEPVTFKALSLLPFGSEAFTKEAELLAPKAQKCTAVVLVKANERSDAQNWRYQNERTNVAIDRSVKFDFNKSNKNTWVYLSYNEVEPKKCNDLETVERALCIQQADRAKLIRRNWISDSKKNHLFLMKERNTVEHVAQSLGIDIAKVFTWDEFVDQQTEKSQQQAEVEHKELKKKHLELIQEDYRHVLGEIEAKHPQKAVRNAIIERSMISASQWSMLQSLLQDELTDTPDDLAEHLTALTKAPAEDVKNLRRSVKHGAGAKTSQLQQQWPLTMELVQAVAHSSTVPTTVFNLVMATDAANHRK